MNSHVSWMRVPGWRWVGYCCVALLTAGFVLWGVGCSDDVEKPADSLSDDLDSGVGDGADDGAGSGSGSGTGSGDWGGGSGGDDGTGGSGSSNGGGTGGNSGSGGGLPDAPTDDWSGFRSLPIHCGSVDSVVEVGNSVRVTATVALGGDYCQAMLQLGRTAGSHFIRAIPMGDNRPGCPSSMEYMEFFITGLPVGEHYVAMRAHDGMLMRKSVLVVDVGEAPADVVRESCRDSEEFLGECGVDLFCDGKLTMCEDKACVPALPPLEVDGLYLARVASVQSSCLNAQGETVEDQLTMPEVVRFLVRQDPVDLVNVVITPEDHEIFEHQDVSIIGKVSAFNFSTTEPGRSEFTRDGGCIHSYNFFFNGSIEKMFGIKGSMSIPHKEIQRGDGQCARGSLVCEFHMELEPFVAN